MSSEKVKSREELVREIGLLKEKLENSTKDKKVLAEGCKDALQKNRELKKKVRQLERAEAIRRKRAAYPDVPIKEVPSLLRCKITSRGPAPKFEVEYDENEKLHTYESAGHTLRHAGYRFRPIQVALIWDPSDRLKSAKLRVPNKISEVAFTYDDVGEVQFSEDMLVPRGWRSSGWYCYLYEGGLEPNIFWILPPLDSDPSWAEWNDVELWMLIQQYVKKGGFISEGMDYDRRKFRLLAEEIGSAGIDDPEIFEQSLDELSADQIGREKLEFGKTYAWDENHDPAGRVCLPGSIGDELMGGSLLEMLQDDGLLNCDADYADYYSEYYPEINYGRTVFESMQNGNLLEDAPHRLSEYDPRRAWYAYVEGYDLMERWYSIAKKRRWYGVLARLNAMMAPMPMSREDIQKLVASAYEAGKERSAIDYGQEVHRLSVLQGKRMREQRGSQEGEARFMYTAFLREWIGKYHDNLEHWPSYKKFWSYLEPKEGEARLKKDDIPEKARSRDCFNRQLKEVKSKFAKKKPEA